MKLRRRSQAQLVHDTNDKRQEWAKKKVLILPTGEVHAKLSQNPCMLKCAQIARKSRKDEKHDHDDKRKTTKKQGTIITETRRCNLSEHKTPLSLFHPLLPRPVKSGSRRRGNRKNGLTTKARWDGRRQPCRENAADFNCVLVRSTFFSQVGGAVVITETVGKCPGLHGIGQRIA